ncbi:MAG: hypothetical protein ACYC1D_09010 [Acidimicrobiales bacterium]
MEASVAEAAAADAVVLLSDHDAFDLPALAERARLFLDTRHRVAGERVEFSELIRARSLSRAVRIRKPSGRVPRPLSVSARRALLLVGPSSEAQLRTGTQTPIGESPWWSRGNISRRTLISEHTFDYDRMA